MDKKFIETVNKYGTAFMLLYPKQFEMLKRELEYFYKKGRIRKVKDPFVELAYKMILCDLYWQKQREDGA